jgi:hypothetical protein
VPDNGEFTVYMSHFKIYALFVYKMCQKLYKKSVPDFLFMMLLYVSSSIEDNRNQQPIPILEIYRMGPNPIFVLVYMTVPKLNKQL